MPSRRNILASGALATGALYSAQSFVAPGVVSPAPQTSAATGVTEDVKVQLPAATTTTAATSGWSAAATIGAAIGVMGVAALGRGKTQAKAEAKEQAGLSSNQVVTPIGKSGFVGASGEGLTVISRCPRTGRAQAEQVSSTAMAAGSDVKTAINGFGRIGRNVLRCWLKRETKPFDIVAINAGSMSPQTTAHLLKYDTVLGTLKADVSYSDDALTIDGKVIKLLSGRDPAAMPWKELGVEVIIESTGAFNSLDGGSKHLEAGAKKVVLTAPGKNCPTYVVGVNEGDYKPEEDTVISNASCTTNGMSSVCKVLDESFDVQYGLMTTTHSYTGDQMILDGRHRDLRRARAGACNIVPTTTGAAKAVAEVLPKYKGKLSGIALRVPTPNVSVVDLVVKVGKKTSKEDVNAALKKAADGPMKGIINFEEQPLVSSDFLQTDYSNSVDAALTMVMGEDLVKVVMWYDNEWGYSQRVIDLTAIVAETMPNASASTQAASAKATGRKFVIGGNWKANGTPESVNKLVEELNAGKTTGDVEVICAPPFVYLSEVQKTLRKDYAVAAQNLWDKAPGAWTGEIPGKMLSDMGIKWVVLGHSERRENCGETSQIVAEKTKFAIEEGLSTLTCIGEKLEAREAGTTFDVLDEQMKPLAAILSEEDWDKVVLAYEPVWAIGTGKVATPEQAEEVHAYLRKWMADNISPAVSEKVRIQYGGSVNDKNSAELGKQPNIDGFLVGGASLKGDAFTTIINSAQTADDKELVGA